MVLRFSADLRIYRSTKRLPAQTAARIFDFSGSILRRPPIDSVMSFLSTICGVVPVDSGSERD